MRISVGALGDAFGRGRMTARARQGIEQVLRRAGVEVVPPLTAEGDGWVTLRVAAQAPAPPPAVRPPFAGPAGPSPLRAVADEVRAQPRPHIPASLAAALALLVPVAVAGAVVGSEADPQPRPAATRAADPRASLLDRAETAYLAGDYQQAVRLTVAADPRRGPALREQIVGSLLNQARTAQRGRAYVRAIRLSRRAARYGSAPGAARIVRQSRAGLDLRRDAQRRAANKPPRK